MDQIRRGWSRDKEGWWYCDAYGRNMRKYSYLKVKVKAGEEDKLFRLPDDQSELQLPNVLQYATHVDIRDPSSGKLTEGFGKALESAADPVPALEGLAIGWGVNQISPVLEAIKSRKLLKLKALAMVDSTLRDGEVRMLARAIDCRCLPSLKYLNLKIVSDGHLQLAKVMESSGVLKLETLNLYYSYMGDDGCEAYANAMSSGKLLSLKCIQFRWNKIGIRGIEAIGRVIGSGKLKNLTELDLSWNQLIGEAEGGKGHIILADHMRCGHLRALEKLDLEYTGMEDGACKAYAQAMRSGQLPCLSLIDFSENQIGDLGAIALGHTIRCRELTDLAILNLKWNAITDDGMVALASSFREGEASTVPNLRKLDLCYNPFTQDSIRMLGESLKSGCLNSLDEIGLRVSEKPSEEGAKALVSAFTINNHLTVDVRFEWDRFPALDRQVKQLRTRNIRNKHIEAGLDSCPKVSAVFGKVYICGDPEVGKTTLRKALPMSFWESLMRRLRRRQGEERTRGIDVSEFSSKKDKAGENPITLVVWDMAGQEDYHLVHNAFFPDLSSAEGKATSFVVVCSSKNKGDESTCNGDDKAQVRRWLQQLDYWLRFIASSCGKSTDRVTDRRHVLVVLNNFKGILKASKFDHDWKRGLEILRKNFKEYLDIQTDPFIMDVRSRGSIQPLKRRLLDHSRNLLAHERVPDICLFIQKNLSDWSKRREQFPVLRWAEFVRQVRESSKEEWPMETLEAATKYLNEAGVIVYIDKQAPSGWNTEIHCEKLVVLDPTWFCSKIVGNMFLQKDMGQPTELLFRKIVDPKTGSISELEFRKFFQPLLHMENEWNREEFGDLIFILLWLGLCYKGGGKQLFIPSLIAEDVTPEVHWESGNSKEYGDNQWVMGFSVEHARNNVALAPIALWHRFQVNLAQTPEFNGPPDNDFTIGKHFIYFCVDRSVGYMKVLIQVSGINEGRPTFDEISVLVKPLRKGGDLDGNTMKQYQVDLANDLSEIVLRLWTEVCPGVEYFQRVVWPWPASQSRPKVMRERNVEVSDVKKWVNEHGLGRPMQWLVGSHCTIKEDQLLSTKHKTDFLQKSMESAEVSLHILKQYEREAVEQGICPADLFSERVTITSTLVRSESCRLVMATLEKIERKIDTIDNLVRDGFKEVLNKESELLRWLQDTGEFRLQDNERTCPRFIYLGGINSSAWMTLKEAILLKKVVRLHFLCEARYNDYRQHSVAHQQGLDLSRFPEWARKIGPWLKVSLAVLFISAKIAANAVLPGVGAILPNFDLWQQASSLAEGLALATSFSKKELDKHIMEGMDIDANDTQQNPRELNGRSRKAISEFLRTLTADDYEKKLGLRKVRLSYEDGSHNVVWICKECFVKYRQSDPSKEVVCELHF